VLSVRYTIFGKVQGVAFRAFTQDNANRLGVVGWVKNNNDGSLECLACADQATLNTLEEKLMDGPSWARVDRIEKCEEVITDSFKDFNISY